MRVCCQCGAADRELPGPDGADHWVVPELRWMEAAAELTPREVRAGWRPKTVQGRPAMERSTCRACLDANAVRDQVWGGLRKAAREAEKPPADNYWRTLCEVEG